MRNKPYSLISLTLIISGSLLVFACLFFFGNGPVGFVPFVFQCVVLSIPSAFLAIFASAVELPNPVSWLVCAVSGAFFASSVFGAVNHEPSGSMGGLGLVFAWYLQFGGLLFVLFAGLIGMLVEHIRSRNSASPNQAPKRTGSAE
jgi:hypothetical protein